MSIMKKLLFSCLFAFLLFSINTDIYANSKVISENQIIYVELIPVKDVLNNNQAACSRWFHLECPEGSVGDGTYFYQTIDCDTGEVIPGGSGEVSFGCDDLPQPWFLTIILSDNFILKVKSWRIYLAILSSYYLPDKQCSPKPG